MTAEEDNGLRPWSEVVPHDHELVPYTASLLQPRSLKGKMFVYFIEDVGWTIGTFDRKGYGEENDRYKVSLGDRISDILQFDVALYCESPSSSTSSSDCGYWGVLRRKTAVVPFEVGHKVICQWEQTTEWYVNVYASIYALCFCLPQRTLPVTIFVFVVHVYRHPGIVSAVNPDGTYNVDYDDGDKEENKTRDQLERD